MELVRQLHWVNALLYTHVHSMLAYACDLCILTQKGVRLSPDPHPLHGYTLGLIQYVTINRKSFISTNHASINCLEVRV